MSTKLPGELVEDLDRIASERGLTRNRLVRIVREDVVEGRIDVPTADEVRLAAFWSNLRATAPSPRSLLDAHVQGEDPWITPAETHRASPQAT